MSAIQRLNVCVALLACLHLASCGPSEVLGGEADAAIVAAAGADAATGADADLGVDVEPGVDAEVVEATDAAVEVDAGAAPDGALEGSVAGECGDGLDNDGNGATDCGDLSCGGMSCRLAAGPCDAVEVCTAGACPEDVLESATLVCRPEEGDCDVAEACTGASPDCPEDAFLPEGASCRAPTGACDAEERCTGAAAGCPADAVEVQGRLCRAAAGSCDVEELCDGASVDCPEDAFLPEATVCRQPVGVCDVAEACDGLSAGCPSDGFQPQGTSCRPAAGPCDAEESCTGTAKACPPDGYEGSTKTCRPAADGCDAPETCTGSSIGCPQDRLRASGFVCRAAAGSCDSVAETCSGTSASCPTDVNGCTSSQYCSGSQCASKKARGVACAVGGECLSGRCADGVCCDTACTSTCAACNLAGHLGTCTNHAQGTDPEDACGRYACNGAGACSTSCTGGCSSTQCDSTGYCAGASCSAKKAKGASCGAGCECSSGHCVDGVCCDGACNGPCVVCNLTGSLGTCRNRAAGTDLENGCGRYLCNSAGACYTSCSGACSSTQCDSTSYCAGTSCSAKKATGATCGSGCECSSGSCFEGSCCTPSCTSGVCGALDGCGGECGAASGCTLHFYFGSNHGHSTYSDGTVPDAGSDASNLPSDHFALTKNADAGYDFYMISDHSQASTKYPQFALNWRNTMRQARDATTPSFVAMWGFEFSENKANEPGGVGHANVFGPEFRYDADAFTSSGAPVTLLTFYDWLVARDYIASFNHPGEVVASKIYDFNGFAGLNHYRRNQMAMIEVCKAGNNCFFNKVVEALNMGWRVAPIIGIDAHQLSSVVRASRTAVLAPVLTRDALLAAMRARHVYATKDSDLEVVYTVNGQLMGSVLRNPSQLQFEISIHEPDGNNAPRITRIEILGMGGRVVVSRSFNDHSVYWKPPLLRPPFDTYYWLRIYSAAYNKGDAVEDEHEGVAYSAPIWIEQVP
ncbi:MAG: hypothetical protein HY901_12410 [Deltaproteobacteria bacterium]|nr:hypothetical protein [Deltaproteobacteria bacterium]